MGTLVCRVWACLELHFCLRISPAFSFLVIGPRRVACRRVCSVFVSQSVKDEMKAEEASTQRLATKKTACQSTVEDHRSAIQRIGFSPDEYRGLENSKDELTSTVTRLSDHVDKLTAQLEGRLSFEYSDPVRGFDRSKVKGLVASLVQVSKKEHATALEVVAGSKLYQVVVDEVITGKALLARGKLKRRVTIIPLDKIRQRNISNAACDRAETIANSMETVAYPAVQLVGFDEEVRNAMEYVFGGTFVVDGATAANRICDETKTKTVTLDGDVYDPSGTISGGSNNNLGTTLSKLSDLATAQTDLEAKNAELKKVTDRLNLLRGKSNEFEKLNRKLELAVAELDGVEKHLSQTKFGMLSAKYEEMAAEIHTAETEHRAMLQRKDEQWALYNELKGKEQELTEQREFRLTQISDEVKAAKETSIRKAKLAREVRFTKLVDERYRWSTFCGREPIEENDSFVSDHHSHLFASFRTFLQAESRSQTLKLELEGLAAELSAAKQAVETATKSLDDAKTSEEGMEIRVQEANSRYSDAQTALEEAGQKMEEFSSEISGLKREKADLIKKVESLELEAKKILVAVARITKEKANAERVVATMLKKHAWISSEMDAFGVAGGDYDFSVMDHDELAGKLRNLKDEQEELVS